MMMIFLKLLNNIGILEIISYKIEYTFKDIIDQEEEISGYGSCEAYLSR